MVIVEDCRTSGGGCEERRWSCVGGRWEPEQGVVVLGDKELDSEVEAVPILGDIVGNKGEIMENIMDRCS